MLYNCRDEFLVNTNIGNRVPQYADEFTQLDVECQLFSDRSADLYPGRHQPAGRTGHLPRPHGPSSAVLHRRRHAPDAGCAVRLPVEVGKTRSRYLGTHRHIGGHPAGVTTIRRSGQASAADSDRLTALFYFPPGIRKAIYKTNTHQCDGIAELLAAKGAKESRSAPNRESIQKILYLAVSNASKKWNRPICDWKAAPNQFVILFERVPV